MISRAQKWGLSLLGLAFLCACAGGGMLVDDSMFTTPPPVVVSPVLYWVAGIICALALGIFIGERMTSKEEAEAEERQMVPMSSSPELRGFLVPAPGDE